MNAIDRVKELLAAKDSNVQSRRTIALSQLSALAIPFAEELVESQAALAASNCHGGERPGYRCPRCAALRLEKLEDVMEEGK